jgi:hypothetical protein
MAHPRPKSSSGADQVLALNLAAAIRTAAYYDADNSVLQQVCSTLGAQLADRLVGEDALRIGVHSHCVAIFVTRCANLPRPKMIA